MKDEKLTKAQPLTRVSWAFEYRNYANHNWRRSVFHERSDGVPATREEALNILRSILPRWVPGTQLRLVEIVETVTVADPIGTFSPERAAPASTPQEKAGG